MKSKTYNVTFMWLFVDVGFSSVVIVMTMTYGHEYWPDYEPVAFITIIVANMCMRLTQLCQ